MEIQKTIGTCSRCGGPVVVMNQSSAACAACQGKAKPAFGPVIEVEAPVDTKKLLLES